MDSTGSLNLMSIPLEIRHTIFEHAAARNYKPDKLLQRYFEKIDVKETIDRIKSQKPNDPEPVPLFRPLSAYDSESEGEDSDADADEDDNVNDQDMNDFDDDSDGDGDVYGDGWDDEDGNEANDGEDDEDSDGDGEGIVGGIVGGIGGYVNGYGDEDSDEDEEDAQVQQVQPATGNAFMITLADGNFVQAPVPVAAPAVGSNVHAPNPSAAQDAHNIQAAEDSGVDFGETSETLVIPAAAPVSAASAPAAPTPQGPKIRPDFKWRHVPKFIRVTHCPPPTELLQVGHTLNREAMDWYYNVAALQIDATASFAHTTMLEIALEKCRNAAFSPIEVFRKVQVKFVWDSELIRDTEGVLQDIWECMLRQRAVAVVELLRHAPNLKEVSVYWYDTGRDTASTILKYEILDMFDEILVRANVKVEEQCLEMGQKPKRKSVLARRRRDFQQIVDAGDHLH